MAISHALITLLLLQISSSTAAEYQIDCTTCSACNNPCGQTYSPPPPQQQSSGGSYYYPPPQQQQQQRPPSQTQPSYYFPPPAPPKYSSYFPGPPPPNPIVPYFPFFYHSPPMPSSGSRPIGSVLAAVAGALLIFLSLLLPAQLLCE